MTTPSRVLDGNRISLVGLGTVGSGWAVIYLANGFDVVGTDANTDAEPKCRALIARAWPALRRLGIATEDQPPMHRFAVVSNIAEAAAGAALVHENAPERLDIKRALYKDIEAAASDDAIIASSTGGLQPSDLQADMGVPGRFVVIHPFNPAHLVPLVEVIGGRLTSPECVDRAVAHIRSIGKHPIRIDKESTGFLTNRLQFALLREAVHCISEGIASPQAIEDAVQHGLGPRWSVMGSLTTLTLAGGTDGMPAVMDRFAPAIELWWAALGDPKLTPAVQSKLIAAAAILTRDRSLPEWESWRDERLIEILKAQRQGGT